jgi:hypothetical protein
VTAAGAASASRESASAAMRGLGFLGDEGFAALRPCTLRREAKSGWARWEEKRQGEGGQNLRIGPCANKYITGSRLCSCARYSTRSLPFRSGWEFSFSLLLVSSLLFVRVY